MGRLRHKIVWTMLRGAVSVFLRLKFNYTCAQAPRIPGPFILVSNHVTDYDPLMVGCSFSQQMYFVASEHLFRLGFVSRILKWLVAPIPRVKGSVDTVSALLVMRALKNKSNVGLFAEGDRSWNGLTGSMHPTTGRLIKASHAALVTYKLTGGYLSSPRWTKRLRRGRMYGHLVNIYSPEQLHRMTPEEVTARINADIYEDAYETQRWESVRYRGRKLAEGLENAIYVCPACKTVCRLKGVGDEFSCACGFKVTYNDYGFFEGENRPFQTVAEWDLWQEKFLSQIASSAGTAPIYEDPEQSLWRIGTDHSESPVASGTLRIYKDRFELGGFSVALSKLYQMGVYGPANIVFSAEGVNYAIKSAIRRSGRKYLTIYNLLTNAAFRGNKNAASI